MAGYKLTPVEHDPFAPIVGNNPMRAYDASGAAIPASTDTASGQNWAMMPDGTLSGDAPGWVRDLDRFINGIGAVAGMPGKLASGEYNNVEVRADGSVSPMSPELISDAATLSGLISEGGFLASKPENSLGIFAGRMSKTADLNKLAEARLLHEAGTSREQIFDKTGWFKGADAQWKYEIPDHSASFDSTIGRIAPDADPMLGDALNHSALLAAYPEIGRIGLNEEGEIPASMQSIAGTLRGWFSPADNVLGLTSKTDKLSTSLHEAQHFIQEKEGFGTGGSMSESEMPIIANELDNARWDEYAPLAKERDIFWEAHPELSFQAASDAWVKANPSKGRQLRNLATEIANLRAQPNAAAYLRLSGETEARNVQTRAKTPVKTYPWQTQDYPDSWQYTRLPFKPALKGVP